MPRRKRSEKSSELYVLPNTGFVRLDQIIGKSEKGLPGVLPISRRQWDHGVKQGVFPKPAPHALGKFSLWRAEDIHALLARINSGEFVWEKQHSWGKTWGKKGDERPIAA